MSATNEVLVNGILSQVIAQKLMRGQVEAERSGTIKNKAGRRPDIIFRRAVGPREALSVVIETEYMPARGVEDDAVKRLGETLVETDEAIEHAVAVRLPQHLKNVGQHGLPREIRKAKYQYCTFAGDKNGHTRWPESGWLESYLDGLVDCIEILSLSEKRITKGADILKTAVSSAAEIFEKAEGSRDAPQKIGELLHQESCEETSREQTNRMAMAIIFNALTFHSVIGGDKGVKNLSELHGSHGGGVIKNDLINHWKHIYEEINYWPIFSIASKLLSVIPDLTAQKILDILEKYTNELMAIGVASYPDLSGRMFQELITDRKFLATFYTLPTSSALLAELAVGRLKTNWANEDAVKSLRIADFACGTGALISAAYRSVSVRRRRAGGDDRRIHRNMMENSLIAADIMPAATHLTASTLSSSHPGTTFSKTRILTMPYGELPPGVGRRRYAIGSLDFIEDEISYHLFGTGRRYLRGVKKGPSSEHSAFEEVPHRSMDMVIMNPPFTRPTNHESTHSNVPVPSFAGFKTSKEEQDAMSAQLKDIKSKIPFVAGHGNAGLGSNFMDVAHAKIKLRGIIALVLPLSCCQGASWENFRELLKTYYKNIVIISLSTTGATNRAFSADTGMAEVLIICERMNQNEESDDNILYVNLYHRPESLLEAIAVARAVSLIPKPTGANGMVNVGSRSVGSYVRASLSEAGCAGLREPALAATITTLIKSSLKLPRNTAQHSIPITCLGSLGKRGRSHRDINGKHPDRSVRGPFDMVESDESDTSISSYPTLWKHEARRERRLIVAPDQEGRVRQGSQKKADKLWEETASRLHFNQDFQINSQSLAACLTPSLAIGGVAWPNFKPTQVDWEEPLALWANTILGLMSFWWEGTRQQSGRARITLSRLPELPVLDIRKLTDAQITHAKHIFADFTDKDFLPANEAYRDDVRKALDRAVLVDLLGLPEDVLPSLDVVREQWCTEPSVHGGKPTRPQNAS